MLATELEEYLGRSHTVLISNSLVDLRVQNVDMGKQVLTQQYESKPKFNNYSYISAKILSRMLYSNRSLFFPYLYRAFPIRLIPKFKD